MIRVKICGITRTRDALLAEKLGADFIGFILFDKSPRYISFRECLKIRNALDPSTRTVGVFVNEDVNRVISIARRLRLDFVQLHGNESEVEIEKVRMAGFKTIKAIPIETGRQISGLKSRADLLLFDSRIGDRFGGTGDTFDHKIVTTVRRKFILAGGLNGSTIQEACRIARPYAIDISSGAESKPGIKSAKKMQQIFDIMRDINGSG